MQKIVATLAVIFSIGLASGAAAQTEAGRAEVLDRLAQCRAVADGGQRLACYDQAAAALDAAERGGDVVVLDRRQVQEARRQLFGFQIGNPFAGRLNGPAAPDIDSIETTLVSAGLVGDGKWLFRLADGSEWRQIDSGQVRFRNRQGEAVRVRRASLGSYLMTVENSRAVRVRRQ
ncbi:hypothetical protein [Brevundimonas sp.]|uniref:hypothetical protein n=1 Tax=Brevundimonas sp. TaxID=1871086 RepID=UPI0035AE82A6